jgi:hypothetical protein
VTITGNVIFEEEVAADTSKISSFAEKEINS